MQNKILLSLLVPLTTGGLSLPLTSKEWDANRWARHTAGERLQCGA